MALLRGALRNATVVALLLAKNPSNFMQTLAMSEAVDPWSLIR
jgi:hypothetical protein